MLKQNSNGMRSKIAAIGCFFKSCLAIAEMDVGKFFTIEDHNTLWDDAVKLGYIVDDNIKNSARITQMAYRKLGVLKTVTEIGTSTGGYYDWIKQNPSFQEKTAFIQKIKQGGPSKTHFRVVDKEDKVIFEPHIPEITSLGAIYTIWYNIKG